jgi:hypothetical protein
MFLKGTKKNGFPRELISAAHVAKSVGYKVHRPTSHEFEDTIAKRIKINEKPVNYDFEKFNKSADAAFTRVFGTNTPKFHPISLRLAVKSLHDDRSAGECISGEYGQKGAVPYSEYKEVERRLIEGGYLPHTKVTFVSYAGQSRKVRTVYNVASGIVANESRFVVPLSQYIQNEIGMDKKVFGLGYTWSGSDPLILLSRFLTKENRKCLDASNFDMTVQSFMIRGVMDRFKKLFILNEEDELVWNALVEYIINTPLSFKGLRLTLSMGILSGSRWTHLLDCMVMLTMLIYLSDDQLDDVIVYGDDSIIDTPVSLEDICKRSEDTHITFSIAKSTTNFEWLGMRYTDGFWEPINRMKRLAKFLFPTKRDENDVEWMKARLQNHLLSSGTGSYANYIWEVLKAADWDKEITSPHLLRKFGYFIQEIKSSQIHDVWRRLWLLTS